MKDKIFTICENLSKVGINPTAEKVRTELGGGSFTKITPLIKEWRDSQKKIEPVPEIPPEALKAVHQATALIWSIANEHQIEVINAIKQEYSRSEQEAIAERDEAMNEVALLEEKLRASEEQVKTLLAKETARANETQSLELQIHKQQLALDSTVNQNTELKAEVRELREKASTAQNESARLAGMLEAFKYQAQIQAPKPEAPVVQETVTDTDPEKATVTEAKAKPKSEPKKATSPKKTMTTAPKKTK
jgi:chromosome segregation ATPase